MSAPWSSLPEAFRQRVEQILSRLDLQHWQATFEDAPPMAVRWTGPRENLAQFEHVLHEVGLAPRPVPFLDEAFHLDAGSRACVRALPAAMRGELALQSAASMAAACALTPQPGEDVLDLCAAPGGKTALLHRLMQGQGRLVANDASRRRLDRLRDQLQQLGIEGVQILNREGAALANELPNCFDRVLVDAPCSGSGRWHGGDPTAWSTWTPSTPKSLARRQVGLVSAACTMVRPGGRVVYSTCTLAPEENEGVLDRLLSKPPVPLRMVACPLHVPGERPPLSSWLDVTFDPQIAAARRIVPGCEGMTGFFIAVLERC
ncbi:MAG: RsmB/NOP family class I SAM-dependent RNA methyltransferase [Phycisphaerales bacterium]|nr:RsmB/NOP family class I SAM-dependent RNA methyltransferase [Phycisphaerales bacterium]